MSQKIFRETSLEGLSSPEQLDQLIKVTSPRAWLVLAALSLILASVVAWSVLGNITTKIEGKGILLNNGGVVSLEHHTAGQVIDVRVKSGDMVKKGEIIARIACPELEKQVNLLLDTISQLESSQRTASSDYQSAINQIEQLRKEMIYQSQVISPIEGRILSLNIRKGSLVKPGETLAAIEQYGSTVRLEAVIYVPAEVGEDIQPGMEARISPSMVNKEEYGYMLGRVIAVADYPSTPETMMQNLGNEALVTQLAGSGAPLKVQIELTPDNNTVSGYKWSSPDGPPTSITSGKLVQGQVVIKKEKPISKVIPLF